MQLRFVFVEHRMSGNNKWALLSLNIIEVCSLLQAAGKYRQLGRNYTVEDGDIIFFKFNTPSAPKKKP